MPLIRVCDICGKPDTGVFRLGTKNAFDGHLNEDQVVVIDVCTVCHRKAEKIVEKFLELEPLFQEKVILEALALKVMAAMKDYL